MKEISIIKIDTNTISVWRQKRLVDISPQVAALTANEGFISHEVSAKNMAESHKIYRDYWTCLNEESLNYSISGIRHKADMVYTHLKNISERIGDLVDVVYAVPSHMTNYQLSLLLGINNALNLSVRGFVDANVAALASAAAPGAYTVLDIQPNQTVITDLDVANKVTSRGSELVPNIGSNNIYHACARHIANSFVRQTRFDPLHDSICEQYLMDALPRWIDESAFNKDLYCNLEYNDEAIRAVIPSSSLKKIIEQNLSPLEDRLKAGRTIAFSRESKIFINASDLFTQHQNIPENAILDAVCDNMTSIIESGSSEFIVELKSSPKTSMQLTINPVSLEVDPESATHITDGKHAVSLSQSPIGLDMNGFILHPQQPSSVTVRMESGYAKIYSNKIKISVNGMTVLDKCTLKGGDEISIDSRAEPFTAITVINSDAS
jgi:hypothetical protein